MREHWTLDPDIDFLNHGSFGACPRAVLEAQSELRARLEREPVTFFLREYEERLDAARRTLADFVGADPADFVFVSNATTGVNAVLRSLTFAPGDRLVTTSHAYNACANALRFVAERAGAEVVVADLPFPIAGPDAAVSAVLDAVDARTRLVLVDHVTSPTGLVLPLSRLVPELESRGVPVLVDGAHAPGMLDLDVSALGASYYTGNWHKWCCAPKGAGFLHVRRDRQEGVHPPVISHGWNTARDDRSKFQVEFDWVGTDDPTAFLAAADSVRYLASLLPGGVPEMRAQNHALACEGRRILLEALEVEPPCPESMLGSLASVPLPDDPSAAAAHPLYLSALQETLLSEHRIEVPIVPWPHAPRRLLRISAHLYNDAEQYRRLAAALSALL